MPTFTLPTFARCTSLRTGTAGQAHRTWLEERLAGMGTSLVSDLTTLCAVQSGEGEGIGT